MLSLKFTAWYYAYMDNKSKYSKASKARWAKVPLEKRRAMMKKLAKKRQAMLTPEQRKKNMKNARLGLAKKKTVKKIKK